MNPYRLSDHELDQLLHDDVPYGDATTWALGISQQPGRMTFKARYDMVLCGSEEAWRLGEMAGLHRTGSFPESGQPLHAGDEILTLEGPASTLHSLWKTAQTLMEYLSGIASHTADIVAAARRGNAYCSVVCTRKHFPGTKRAALKAILCAGASPHRLGLSETLLVFPEHRAFLGNESPRQTLQRLRQLWPERRVVVEVSTSEEALIWVEAGVDVLQLEKMSPDAVNCLKQRISNDNPVRLAAAGGINAANAQIYAQAGADILVTSAPFFATPRDVAVCLMPIA